MPYTDFYAAMYINIWALVGGGHASDCRPATNTNSRANNKSPYNRTNNYNSRHFSLIKHKINSFKFVKEGTIPRTYFIN